MQKFLSQEQVVYFMRTGSIKLSRQDAKFLFNIQTYLLKKKPITTNQVELYKKILFKYQKQFTNQQIDVEKLIELPWGTEIIQSINDFTDPKIEIKDNKIYFYVPFNSKFLKYFRKQENNQEFSWSKNFHGYIANFSTANIKLAITSAQKFYKDINYCNISKNILNTVNSFSDVKYWNPTLVRRNGHYYIAASNKHLDSSLENINLNDDNITLAILCEHGVRISEEIISDKEKKFFSEFYTEIEYSELNSLIKYLVELKCDAVFISEASFSFLKNKTILGEKLEMVDIPLVRTSYFESEKNSIEKYRRPVRIFLFKHESVNSTMGMIKIIVVTNSNTEQEI